MSALSTLLMQQTNEIDLYYFDPMEKSGVLMTTSEPEEGMAEAGKTFQRLQPSVDETHPDHHDN
jgi:hypothetical protein